MAHRPRLSGVFLLLVLALVVTLSLPAPSPAQSSGNLPPDLRALVNEALKANPEMKQMGSTFKASKETIRSAGALDDPEVSFAMQTCPPIPGAFSQDPMTQKMLELSQKFPFPASAACVPKWPPSKPSPMNIHLPGKGQRSASQGSDGLLEPVHGL